MSAVLEMKEQNERAARAADVLAAQRPDNFLSLDRLANLAAEQYAADLGVLQHRYMQAYLVGGDWADYEHEIGEAVRQAMRDTSDECVSVRRSCIGSAAMSAMYARANTMAAKYVAANKPSAIDLPEILEDDRAFKRWAAL